MRLSVFDSAGISIKAPDAHGPSDSAVQTIFVEWERPETLPASVLDTRKSLDLRVDCRGASIDLRGFDVEQPETFRLRIRPHWAGTEPKSVAPAFPPPNPPAFEPFSAYDSMVEGVHAAAGTHEALFYTKWFSIDGPERYFYHRKADGSLNVLGRMNHWRDDSGEKFTVEMPLFGDDFRDFDSVFAAEDYVTHKFAQIPAGA